MSKIEYYILGEGYGRNTGIHVMQGNWPGGVLNHRGLSAARLLWHGEATEEEAAEIAISTRFLCQGYDSAEALLWDERRILEEHPRTLAQLETMLAPLL